MRRLVLIGILIFLVAAPALADLTAITINASFDGVVGINNVNQTYSSHRSGSGNYASQNGSTNYVTRLRSNTLSGYFYNFYTGVEAFNTSPVGSNIIASAKICIDFNTLHTLELGTPSFGITTGRLLNLTQLSNGDFQNRSDIEAISRVNFTNIPTNSRVCFPITNLSTINHNGITPYFFRDSWDLDNNYNGDWVGPTKQTALNEYGIGNANANTHPYINVTYGSDSDLLPPISITGLGNDTIFTSCGSINFTWQNSVDSRYPTFGYVNTYTDNTFFQNISYPTNYTFQIPLSSGTHTISTRTGLTDISLNSTWVNYSYTLPACSAAIPGQKVLITFDDGETSDIWNAYPILAKYGYNATSFIITNKTTDESNGYMALYDLNTLYSHGWDIGDHTRNHVTLTTCSTEMQGIEIGGAKSQLDAWGFTRSSAFLAYPNGDYNSGVETSAQNVGILMARTSDVGHVYYPYIGDYWAVPTTLVVLKTTSVSTVENTISGAQPNEIVWLMFHEIYNGNSGYDYNWQPSQLRQLANFLHDGNYSTLTVSQAYLLMNSAGYNWSFGDGTTSTDQNPQHTYTTAGTYDVSLTTCNAHGCDTMSKTAYITASDVSVPVAGFTKNRIITFARQPITITDTSTNTPTSWQLSWGDGSANATALPASHSYPLRIGYYPINLEVCNAAGCGYARDWVVAL